MKLQAPPHNAPAWRAESCHTMCSSTAVRCYVLVLSLSALRKLSCAAPVAACPIYATTPVQGALASLPLRLHPALPATLRAGSLADPLVPDLSRSCHSLLVHLARPCVHCAVSTRPLGLVPCTCLTAACKVYLVQTHCCPDERPGDWWCYDGAWLHVRYVIRRTNRTQCTDTSAREEWQV